MRRRMPAIVHARWSFGVIALGELSDPVSRVARHGRNRHGCIALAEQPENVPPTALIGLFRRPIAALEFIDAQVWMQMEVSGHATILQPPTSKPYNFIPHGRRSVTQPYTRYL